MFRETQETGRQELKNIIDNPRRDGGSSHREEKIGGVKRRATRKQSPGRICGCSFLPFSFLPSVFFARFVHSNPPRCSVSLSLSLSLTRTHSSSSTDGSAAFLFQGSRQQSSHYRNKTTRRSALLKKEKERKKERKKRKAARGSSSAGGWREGDDGGSGSPDRLYHLVRSTHHMSKQRDREQKERNYYRSRRRDNDSIGRTRGHE